MKEKGYKLNTDTMMFYILTRLDDSLQRFDKISTSLTKLVTMIEIFGVITTALFVGIILRLLTI